MKKLLPAPVKRVYHRVRNRYALGVGWRGAERLNLGCGDRLLDGWANVDFNGWAGVIAHDLTKPFPVPSGSIEFIYTEHFIEHVSRESGAAILKECHRVLKPGGALRVSTPDLRALVADYLAGNNPAWARYGWATGCQMLNGSARDWGHQFIYDYDELALSLADAGFTRYHRAGWRASAFEELRGLETREDNNDLIVEAVR
jgi:predicted SAM-dependent methyltransferase